MASKKKQQTLEATPKTAPPPKVKPPAPPEPRTFRFRRGSHVELAQALIAQLEVIFANKLRRPVYDEGSLHAYDIAKGIWVKVDEVRAGRIVQGFDASSPVKLKDSDVRGALSCARREVAVDGFFASAPTGLTFKDGLYATTATGDVERLDLSTDNRARFAYDFDYTTKKPERFLNALRGMFKPDADADEKIQLVCEFAGVCLLGQATRLQRWILLKGGGDDGKSTLIDMIRGAMPEGSTCSIKPEELEKEYSRADLAGKLLNTVTEVKQRDILDAETLKAVTSGDEMRGRKIRESPIDFKPRAGHIFAANGFPKFSDSSHGFWRRPIVVMFNRRFTGDPEREVGLAETILQSERAEIVCWLVRAGSKALARGAYVEPKSHDRALREWRGETDAVFEFVQESLVVVDKRPITTFNGWTYPYDLYRAFLSWAAKTGHKEMSSTAFGRRLTELGYPEVRSGGLRYRPLRILKQDEFKGEDGTVKTN